MAESRSNGKKKNGIVKLKIVAEKLLLLGKRSKVPGDVKEGHLAVVAVDDGELQRFVVPLSYLTRPPFMRLLEQAAEEYGFDHDGALTVPCRPLELERILAEERGGGSGGGNNWCSCKIMVKSC